jgi:hypothetical protein
MRAGGGKWHYVRASLHSNAYVTDGSGSTVINCTSGEVPANCAAFLEHANPYAALALLDELEAAEKRIAEQREYFAGVIADGSKRIAELEARTLTVKLPRDCEHDVMAPIAAFMLNDGYEFDGEDYASLSGRVRNEIETVLRRTLRIAGIALDTGE